MPKKAVKNTKAVAKSEPKAVAKNDAINYAADAGMGLEGADKDSYAIPFLTVLQGLSPQLETVNGAKPGLFINTITNEIFKTVQVIPCAFQRRFIRWAPREEGGGFRGQYSPVAVETGKVDGLERTDEGRYAVEGDELKDTRHHYLLLQSASGSWQPALMSLASTQVKKSKRWLSLIQGIEMRTPQGKTFNPPSFSHIYQLRAVKEENNQGAWWGLEVEVVGPVEDVELYNRAKAFHKSVASGEVEAPAPPTEAEEAF